jgi:fucose permease
MLILATILAIFVYGLIAAMLGTILPDLSARFKLSPEQNGRIAFAQALGLIISSLGVGPLNDSLGKKVGFLLALSLVTFALFMLPKSSGFGAIRLYIFLVGLGGGAIVNSAFALISDISKENQASTGTLVNLFFGLGGLVTPFVSANLFKGNAIKLCYFVAAIAAVTLIYHALTPIPGPTGTHGFQFDLIGIALGKPALWLLSLMLFLYVSCEVGVWNWLSQHLIAQGIPEKSALNILSLGFALGILVGRAVISQVLTKVEPDIVTLCAGFAMAVTTFWALRTRSAGMAGVAVFLAGASMAPVFPTVLGIVGTMFQSKDKYNLPDAVATAQGVAQAAGWLGLAVSSRIIGAIAGGDPKRLKTALLVIPVASIVMALANFALRAL